MKKYKYVILGGGTTAGYAAKEFAENNIPKDELCIISDEYILPMDRPPLSKEFMADDAMDTEEVQINDREFYDKNGFVCLFNTTATSVDLENKVITMNNDIDLTYEYLLIATGSRLNLLNIKGSDKKNVFHLRTADHAKKIREAARDAKNAVVIGGQYIGSEIASSLRKKGLNVHVVFPHDRMLSKFASADIAAYIHNLYHEEGVELHNNDKVVEIAGNDRVEKVILNSGKTIDADMVVAGIGVTPNTELFKGSSLKVDDGIKVDEHLETNVPGVYAAGDIAHYPDQVFDKWRRVEHWENAFEQGKLAAANMMGEEKAYGSIPFFFSDIFDLSYEYFGDNENADTYYNRGDVKSGNFSSWWFMNGRPVAAFVTSNRPEEERELASEWISGKVELENPEDIQNEEIDLSKISKTTEK
jgi:NADPH-dependent 2,4-dienoyl-CoA reductase/sulfur reductase-like enzyme